MLTISCLASVAAADKAILTPEQMLRNYGVHLDPNSLINALSSDQAMVRENAAKLIGMRRETSAVRQLKEQLNDPYVYARLAAAGALARLDERGGLETLRRATKDSDGPTALYAARELVKVGDGFAFDAVLRIAKESLSPLDRLLAVSDLHEYSSLKGEAQVIHALLQSMRTDSDIRVRQVAAQNLRFFKHPDVHNEFSAAVRGDDEIIKGIAREYLRKESE